MLASQAQQTFMKAAATRQVAGPELVLTATASVTTGNLLHGAYLSPWVPSCPQVSSQAAEQISQQLFEVLAISSCRQQ